MTKKMTEIYSDRLAMVQNLGKSLPKLAWLPGFLAPRYTAKNRESSSFVIDYNRATSGDLSYQSPIPASYALLERYCTRRDISGTAVWITFHGRDKKLSRILKAELKLASSTGTGHLRRSVNSFGHANERLVTSIIGSSSINLYYCCSDLIFVDTPPNCSGMQQSIGRALSR